jgi:hypothetical protein
MRSHHVPCKVHLGASLPDCRFFSGLMPRTREGLPASMSRARPALGRHGCSVELHRQALAAPDTIARKLALLPAPVQPPLIQNVEIMLVLRVRISTEIARAAPG